MIYEQEVGFKIQLADPFYFIIKFLFLMTRYYVTK